MAENPRNTGYKFLWNAPKFKFVESASYAYFAESASFATTASYSIVSVTSSITTSSSFADTASYTPNAVVTASATSNDITFTKGDGSTFVVTIANSTETGSLLTTASFSDPNLTFTKGDGSTFIIDLTTLTVTTASYALSALSASYAVSASYEIVKEVSSSYADTASFAQSGNGIFSGSFSGSFVGDGSGLTNVTASFVPVGLGGIYGGNGTVPLNTTASINGDFTFLGLDEDTRLIVRDGNNGGQVHLFSDGAAGQSALEYYNPAGTSLFHKIQIAGGDTRYQSNERDLVFSTSTSSFSSGIFITSSNGDVGIGTVTPNYKLDVNGTTNINGNTTITGSVFVHQGNVNIDDNSYFFQGTSVGGSNVSLIGVNNQDEVSIGNLGYTNVLEDNTIISGSLTVTSLLENPSTALVSYNTSSGEIFYTNDPVIDSLTINNNLNVGGDLTVTGSFISSGSIRFKTYRLTTGSYTASLDDYRIGVRYTQTGSVSIQLPLISTSGEIEYKFKDEEGNAKKNNITIIASGSDLIDGDVNAILNRNYMAISLYNDGTSNWFIE